MHTLQALQKLAPESLLSVAKELGILPPPDLNQEALVYTILDKQALLPRSNKQTPSRRTAKATKEQGSEAEKTTSKASNRRTTKVVTEKGSTAKQVPTAHKTSSRRITKPTQAQETEGGKATDGTGSSEANKRATSPVKGNVSAGEGSGARDASKPLPNKQPNSLLAMSIEAMGTLELMPDGFGLLRAADYNYLPSPDDVYVGHHIVKQWGLKTGDTILGKMRIPKEGEKYFALTEIFSVNGCTLEQLRERVAFQHLTPLFAEEKYNIVQAPNNYAARIIDLLAPIGKGQRSMIVAPPKAGKSVLLKEIANGIAHNHPEAYCIFLMISERPEELTDIARTVKAEVIGSTFDEPAENHVKVANLTISKAKRLVECGHDVVLFVDSITRLARAYNVVVPSSGRILSGGIDINAMEKPKRLFGAARNVENGGSLTIIATSLIDTGSRGDEVIFEEFKGTGNQEVLLDRRLANKRFYPAIDVHGCSTRRDDKLQPEAVYKRLQALRYILAERTSKEAIETLLNHMRGTKDNQTFLASMQQ